MPSASLFYVPTGENQFFELTSWVPPVRG